MERVEQVDGLAVDWINRLMYWTKYNSSTIEVATLDGLYRSVLINTKLQYPRGMAVDPIAGYVTWLLYYKALTAKLIYDPHIPPMKHSNLSFPKWNGKG